MPMYWEQPTSEDKTRGIIAVCIFARDVWIGNKFVTIEQPAPYDRRMMDRRYRRLGIQGIPEFLQDTYRGTPARDKNNLDDWFPRYEWADTD